MKIGFASDHAGFDMKMILINYLSVQNFDFKDFGTYSTESADYPDYAHPLALAVENKEVDFGIAICGSGNGINITVNKHQGIRSALCWTAEIAELARLHNDANICAIPARFISEQVAKEIIDKFLITKFEGGRHCVRVEKIPVKH